MPLKPNELAEQNSKFRIGDVLLAEPYGGLQHPITGQVERIYENSLLIEITDNQKDDQITVTEMNHRAVVPMDSVEIIKHGPKPKPADGDGNKK
ncbi:hypothetical protein [Oenococcus oeni]|uniref:DUF2187 domain-containing protein n=8 Tax=Oenococcus oeni TaxID=1247 RepID=Q04FF7_OENOB|nr:hypothetical protein [Oenococcus oeni]EAV39756.1 hypothetical protein OENOO_47014 [Oenococcus oeni ATCC BAA-1163]ABJ56815.1 hypothetical protein OEOE_0898 [Oenococcus oeni PSU-1]AVI94047.1 hypothetical protein AX764_04020 [Oenococcus oeni]AWW99603.1 hypothetical protein C5H79_09120 [Oenococcus oeni]EFD88455.1 hypothetical protein AWRIB429_0875 [Oenococcus oeni AWRIB429]